MYDVYLGACMSDTPIAYASTNCCLTKVLPQHTDLQMVGLRNVKREPPHSTAP